MPDTVRDISSLDRNTILWYNIVTMGARFGHGSMFDYVIARKEVIFMRRREAHGRMGRKSNPTG
jgi:hypothetical protein